MKFSIKGFFSKCGQIRTKLRIQSHLLKKSLIENFIFCAVRGRKGGGCTFKLSSAQELFVIRVRDNDKGYLIKDRSLFVDVIFIIINFKTSKYFSILSFWFAACDLQILAGKQHFQRKFECSEKLWIPKFSKFMFKN